MKDENKEQEQVGMEISLFTPLLPAFRTLCASAVGFPFPPVSPLSYISLPLAGSLHRSVSDSYQLKLTAAFLYHSPGKIKAVKKI